MLISSRPRELVVSGVVILGLGFGAGIVFSPDPEPEVKVFTETETVTETVEVPAEYPAECFDILTNLPEMRQELIDMGKQSGGLNILGEKMFVLNASLSTQFDAGTAREYQQTSNEYATLQEEIADHGIEYLKLSKDVRDIADNCADELESSS